MELMDRALQRTVLQQLAAVYPKGLQPAQMGLQDDTPSWTFQAMYLHENGLIRADVSQYMGGGMSVHFATITARGLDFLQDDGGLSAILNTLTVRLDAEQLRLLIEQKVDESDMPPAEKSKLKKWLREAGGAGLKEATTRLVNAALDHAPDALQLLRTMLG